MVKIRLARFGRRNDPFYRIIAIDERRRREGKPLANLGTYNPKTKKLDIDKKLMDKWIVQGAQISTGVKRLLDPNFKPKKKKAKTKKEEK